MHLVRPIRNPQRTNHRPQIRQRRILTHTRGTVRLHRAVDDGKRGLRDEDLGLGDFLEGGFGVALVDFDSGVEDDEAGGVDFDARACDPFEDDAVGGEVAAEGLFAVVVDADNEPFDGFFGGADGAHGVVDAAGAQAALDDFEAAAFAQDHAGGGDADIVEADVAVAVGGVVVAVDGQHAVDGDAGGVGGDEEDGLLAVGVAVGGVSLAHDQVDGAAGVTGAGGPPFLIHSASHFQMERGEGKEPYRSVQNVFIALPTNIQLNISSITRRNIRLRHQKRRPYPPLQQRLQPLPLLRLIPILRQNLHITRIRRGIVRRLGRHLALAQVLGHQAVLEIREAGALGEVVFGEEHVPEAEGAGFGFEGFDDRGVGLPSRFAGAELGVEEGICWDAVFFDERFNLLLLVEYGMGLGSMGEYQVKGLSGLVADKRLSDGGNFGRHFRLYSIIESNDKHEISS